MDITEKSNETRIFRINSNLIKVINDKIIMLFILTVINLILLHLL